MNDQQLSELIEGLKINKLDNYSHIINGYIGSDGFLKQLKSTVEHLKQKNPNLIFVCDPVMGDTEPGIFKSKDKWGVMQTSLKILFRLWPGNKSEIFVLKVYISKFFQPDRKPDPGPTGNF